MENLYIKKIVRHGTSLGIVIPIELLRALGLQRGDSVVVAPVSPGQFLVSLLNDEKIKELKMQLANLTIKI